MDEILTLPQAQYAFKIQGPNVAAVDGSAPLPNTDLGDVRVRVIAVSINHVDGKAADMSHQIGAASGTDFSGIIAALGSHIKCDVWREDKGIGPVKAGTRR